MHKKSLRTVTITSLGVLGFIMGTAHYSTAMYHPPHETDEEFNSRMKYQQKENEETKDEIKNDYIKSNEPSAPPPSFDPSEEAGDDEKRIDEFQKSNQ